MSNTIFKIEKGKPHPLGATPDDNGVNFSVYSEHSTAIELLIFDGHLDEVPIEIIKFDPVKNRTFNIWHIYIRNLKAGAHYAFRIDGINDFKAGHRFNSKKVLIDVYAKGNNNHLWDRVAACNDQDNLTKSMRSVVVDVNNYDWEDDKPLNYEMKDSIIYEMHVGGFTKSSTYKAQNPGTFKELITKIPYLKSLGVTAVELLPVFQFDDTEVLKVLNDGTILKNYWGYSTFGFFSPHPAYCVTPEEGSHLNEFRDMVKALHKEGLEVILDVVFNHSNEGNHQGPTISFKGFDNKIYYYLVPDDPEFYYDFSGCGNTINCNHPAVEKFILDCLKFWVKEMHVDGFRFDEGSILSRGEDGNPLKHPPVLWGLELDEAFDGIKLIAEAWDAAGLYQIGSFPGYRWSEWNGKYRDSIRKFTKGDSGLIGEVANRIAGSSELYQHNRHRPTNGINFIACHDGFTIMDLVSYNEKHNYANGENNQDGIDDNLSWNSGTEGETDSLEIINFRKKRIKNFAAILFCSQGVPMILSGDEVGKSQLGNNNVYCQDNELAWFDWTLVEKNSDLLRFFKSMIKFRKDNESLRRGDFFNGEINSRGLKDIDWHGCKLTSPGWNDSSSKVLAFSLASFVEKQPDIYVIMNMDYQELDFEIPTLVKRKWYRFVDTDLDSPNDIIENSKFSIKTNTYKAAPYSVIILISK